MKKYSTIRDINLHDEGEVKIRWVARRMHCMNRLSEQWRASGAFKGKRVAVCVHLEAKTAYLAIVLAQAGAERVVATGSNPNSTQDDVCAALVKRGIEVHAWNGATPSEFRTHLLATLDSAKPHLIIDDGAELVAALHRDRPQLAAGVLAASEETTSGVIRLRALAQSGQLQFPCIAANNARCKHLFDNRTGTGQSSIAAFLSATNTLLAGRCVVVVGFGYVGRGLAEYAAGNKARVVVVEHDPIKALEAHIAGHQVMALAQAAPLGDVFLTATGSIGVLRRDHFLAMRDGALVANAGNYKHEIDEPALRQLAQGRVRTARRHIDGYTIGDSTNTKEIFLLAGGELVNIAAGDGHPIEIMDLSFSVQGESVHYLAKHHGELSTDRVHPLPDHIDQRIARQYLLHLGVTLDEPTAQQVEYSQSWEDPAEPVDAKKRKKQ